MKILFESKQLNEGPGAGYTIESSGYSLNGKLLKVKMTDIGSSIKFECDVDFTGTVSEFEASAYYTGTGKVHDLPISCYYVELEVSKDIAWNNELVDDDVTTYDEQQLLEEILDTLAGASCEFGYGGGYSHSTYDGQVTDDYLSADYHDIKADIYLTNDEDIKKVDRMVDGYGYDTLYEVVFDGVGEDAFEDESEAIEYAKKHGAEEVRIIYQSEDWNGDVDIEGGETVWTNDDMDESLKESEDSIEKETDDGLGKGSAKEMSNVIFDTLFNNTQYPQFDFSKVENQEVDANKGQIVFDYMGHEYKITVEESAGHFTEAVSKNLTEDFDEDERIQALAEYLNIDPSEISNIYDNEFETPEGDYLVVDEYEAEQLAREDIENLYDDLGLDSFTPGFKDWIIMNALDNEWFEDAIKESYEYYVEDIEDESSSMGYENRLIEEMHDHQVLSDDDFEEGEDGEPDLSILKDDVDIDDKKEEFIDLLVENAGNPIDYCADNYGWDWVTQMATQNNLIDMGEVVDQCIYEDGIAHFIARYDGREHELGNGLFAYRTN